MIAVRRAGPDDLRALIALEAAAFTSDRLSGRSFQRLLGSPTAICIVATSGGRVVGYALLLFRRSSTLARLYSIAVEPELRGRGIAARLMASAEAAAAERGARALRLEVRDDNRAAAALYRGRGYHQFGRLGGYYQDHADALRFEKQLRPRPGDGRGRAADPISKGAAQ